MVLTYEVFELGADVNGSGEVDLIDFAMLASQWGDGCSEPGWVTRSRPRLCWMCLSQMLRKLGREEVRHGWTIAADSWALWR